MPIVPVPNIVGYHCNDSTRCERFVSEDFLIWSTEDGEWLGSGMYFWDNAYNASVYWKHHKISQDRTKKYITVKANILIDNILDLTDWDIVTEVAKVWNSYCELLHYDAHEPLGKKLNFLFQHKQDFSSSYYVIKIYGKYNKTIANQLFEYDVHSRHDEPSLSVKCIYSIRSPKCIVGKSLFDEG